MTDPNDTPNAVTTPNPDVVVGLGAVSARAVAGEATPQPAAASAADQPTTAPQPAGTAPAAQEPTVATPGAADEGAAGAALAPLVRFAPGTEAHRDIFSNLNAIEQLAVFWGGDTGVKIRNHVGRIRDLLQ